MENNLLFIEQDIFTLTPLLFSVLIALMVVTKKWEQEINTMLFLVVDGICTSIYMYGFVEEAFYLLSFSAVVAVVFAFFRKRRECDKERDEEENNRRGEKTRHHKT
jgi:hypothetical protein